MTELLDQLAGLLHGMKGPGVMLLVVTFGVLVASVAGCLERIGQQRRIREAARDRRIRAAQHWRKQR